MKIYNPNLEERAFLYQEAQDLAPLVKDLGSLSIMVEQTLGKEDEPAQSENRYRVTFVVAPESVGMEIQAEEEDLFSATIAAKEEAQRQLNALVNALDPQTAVPSILH